MDSVYLWVNRSAKKGEKSGFPDYESSDTCKHKASETGRSAF